MEAGGRVARAKMTDLSQDPFGKSLPDMSGLMASGAPAAARAAPAARAGPPAKPGSMSTRSDPFMAHQGSLPPPKRPPKPGNQPLAYDPFLVQAKKPKVPPRPPKPGDSSVMEDPFLTQQSMRRGPPLDLRRDPMLAHTAQTLPYQHVKNSWLQVDIFEARELRNQDFHGKSDPYVQVEIIRGLFDPRKKGRSCNACRSCGATVCGLSPCCGKPTKVRTRTVPNSARPVWDYHRRMAPLGPGDGVKFTVFDWDAWTNDDHLGVGILSVDEIYPRAFNGWLPLARDENHAMERANKIFQHPPKRMAALKLHAAMGRDGVNLQTDPFLHQVKPKRSYKEYCAGCAACMAGCRECCTANCLACLDNTKYCCTICGWQTSVCCLTCCAGCGYGSKACWAWCSGRHTLRRIRHDLRRKLGLSDVDTNDSLADSDVACCCIPLRTAVFLVALVMTVVSLKLWIAQRTVLHGQIKAVTGGYALQSRVITGTIQLFGILFGIFGMVGAIQLSKHFLSLFRNFQIVHLIGMALSMFIDAPLLMGCELWTSNMPRAIQTYGWNADVYNIALAKKCRHEQLGYSIFSVIAVAVSFYFLTLTQRLISDIDWVFKYLHEMPDDIPSNAFMDPSLRPKHSSQSGYGTLPPQATAGPGGEPVGPSGLLGSIRQQAAKAQQEPWLPPLVGQPVLVPPTRSPGLGPGPGPGPPPPPGFVA